MPLPSNFNTENLKGYHYLDEGCTWAYARFTETENIKEEIPGNNAHVFVFHIKCENKQGVTYPRAYKIEHPKELDTGYKGIVWCTGCRGLVPEFVLQTATIIWLMERTKYA